MLSNIYQISSSPISKDDYREPDDYYDNSGDFADYIGDEHEGKDRDEAIENFADIIKDVFAYKGDGVFEYLGPEALRKFNQAWLDELKRQTAALTPDSLLKENNLFRIGELAKKSHLNASSRVDIDGWNGGLAYPLGELFEWANSQLKEGDCIYIGAVIDYHW